MKDVQTLEKAASMALKTLEYIDLQDNDRDFLSYKECHDLDEAITALRQALEQPASKPWVGLTNKEWQDIVDDSKLDNIGAIKTAIEAKLKEKNS